MNKKILLSSLLFLGALLTSTIEAKDAEEIPSTQSEYELEVQRNIQSSRGFIMVFNPRHRGEVVAFRGLGDSPLHRRLNERRQVVNLPVDDARRIIQARRITGSLGSQYMEVVQNNADGVVLQAPDAESRLNDLFAPR